MEERQMKYYTNSDYALNKYSEGIVYKFADGIAEITLVGYLVENPGKVEADFFELKELSDNIYLDQVRSENVQTKKNSPFNEFDETILCCSPSPEDLHISKITLREEAERREQRLGMALSALDSLTEVQRRRYLLFRVDGLTLRQIANKEGVVHSKIQNSINAAENKIKKFLANA
jgi:hypothetical protein